MSINEVDYITIDEFIGRYNIKMESARKTLRKYPQIQIVSINGKLCVREDSRYPYNLRNTSIKKREEKMYVLLKATRNFEYIDNQMLKISKSSFDTLIKELLSYSLLQENGSNNKCGANSFDTTIKGGEIALQKKEKAMLDLAEITGTFTGTFAGKIVSSLQNNTP